MGLSKHLPHVPTLLLAQRSKKDICSPVVVFFPCLLIFRGDCLLKKEWWEFPGDPVITTPCFHCRGHGFNPWETKILQATWHAKTKTMFHSTFLSDPQATGINK